MSSFQQLVKMLTTINSLGGIEDLLGFDLEVSMPAGGADARARQSEVLAGVIQEKLLHPDLEARLEDAAKESLTEDEQVTIERIRWQLVRARAVNSADPTLVARIASASSRTQTAWHSAKTEAEKSPQSDTYTSMVLGPLEELVGLQREAAAAIASATGAASPWDALHDEYEYGSTAAQMARLYEEVLVIAGEVLEEMRSRELLMPEGQVSPQRADIPADRQLDFCRRLAVDLGMDPNTTCIAAVQHPFMMQIGPGDLRVCVAPKPSDALECFDALRHEVGHGLHSAQQDPAYAYTPRGDYGNLLGLAESQSLFWENCVGRSPGYNHYFLPLLRQTFPEAFGNLDFDSLLAWSQRVHPGLIRIAADEVTYPMHVAIRFQLEQAFINGDLSLEELPGAWDDAYESNLGLRPPNQAVGVLQDIHWHCGLIGYFPTYGLGHVMAPQYLHFMDEQLGGIRDALSGPTFEKQSDWVELFSRMGSWLANKVHRPGCKFSSMENLKNATGTELDLKYWRTHLESRYLDGDK